VKHYAISLINHDEFEVKHKSDTIIAHHSGQFIDYNLVIGLFGEV